MSSKKSTSLSLSLGALGVVFGDIGTSPIYALAVVFGLRGLLDVNQQSVFGVISLILWSATLIVSIKYVALLMRVSSNGEGGEPALLSYINRFAPKAKQGFFTVLGIIGIALFFGDSVITPAISVLSSVEGLPVIAPGLKSVVLPVTIVLVLALFWVQRYGTGAIGKFFGPIMLIWFLMIGGFGAWNSLQYPTIFRALSPLEAVGFIVDEPVKALIALTAVLLAITGAEALYADMGHFGRKAIKRAWLYVVFPALMLSYFGQGAYLLKNGSVSGLFFYQFPEIIQPFAVVLAASATLIASQSVISGAFSIVRQAIQLNFLPKLGISHTSDKMTGQIYIPSINFILCVFVVLVVLLFETSEGIAHAYGLAVSGTLLVSTLLLSAVLRFYKKLSIVKIVLIVMPFLALEVLFVAANSTKFIHGGWFTLALAVVLIAIMLTWRRGRQIITDKRRTVEGQLVEFSAKIRNGQIPVTRVPGQVVYIGHHPGYTPLALLSSAEDLHELHEQIVVVYVEIVDQAHVPSHERAHFNGLGFIDGICELTLKYGYKDRLNIPHDLEQNRELREEFSFDPKTATYFISSSKVVVSKNKSMAFWRKSLYAILARNAETSSGYYNLPIEKTIITQTFMEI